MKNKIKIILTFFIWNFIQILLKIYTVGADLNNRGESLGCFIFKYLPYRKKIVIRNLKLVFKEKTEDEILLIAKNTYIFFATMILEIFTKIMTGKEIALEYDAETENILHNYKKYEGFILATGHFSNWEMGNILFNGLGVNLAAVYQRIHNSFIDDKLKSMRALYGTKNIEMKKIRDLIRFLKLEQGVIILLIDQDAKKRGQKIEFLDLPTYAYSGAVKLAQLSGKPIITGFSYKENGKYKIKIGEPIVVDKKITNEEEIIILEKLNNDLANMIRKYPEQWFWFHKRWKHLY